MNRISSLGVPMLDRMLSRRDALKAGAAVAATGSAGVSLLARDTNRVVAQEGDSTIVIAIDADPEHLNMALTSSVTVQIPACMVQQGLIVLDRSYAPTPELAESWEVSDDSTEYVFHLQQGVTWSDGTPFTSADVKFSIEEVALQYQPIAKSTFERIAGIDTPDDHTVVITLSEPYGPFMNSLECDTCPILPKHVFEGQDVLTHPSTLENPIGTGPYLLEEWRRGEGLTFTRNPNYWKADLPHIDRVVVQILPQATGRASALMAGEVDYLLEWLVDRADVAQFEDNPDFLVEYGLGSPGNLVLSLNVRNEPLSNPLVRQALMTATDRQFLIDAAYFGIGEVATSAITPRLPWANNPDVNLNEMYAYDPERASTMLDEAGLTADGDGNRFSFRLVYSATDANFPQVAESLRSQWSDVGVNVELLPLDEEVLTNQVFVNYDFDGVILGLTTSGDPAVGIQRLYHTDAIDGRPYRNASGYSNPEVDRLFDEGATKGTQEERAPFYHDLQVILAEDLPSLVLIDIIAVDLASARFNFPDTLWKHNYPIARWDEVSPVS